MLSALRDGFRSVGRNRGLLAVLLTADLVCLGALRALGGAPEGRLLLPGRDLSGLAGLAACVLVQAFAAGGLLAVLRNPAGGWSPGGLLHGSRFYFARVLRVGLLGLAATLALVALDDMGARAADGVAKDAWQAALLAGLVLVHMTASYAAIVLVRGERLSAALAFVSSLGFCVRNFLPALGQYLAMGAVGLGLAAGLDRLETRLAAVALLVVSAGLRLSLLAAQSELFRARSAGGE
jgi:hypothetical protein